jgi:acetate kinase
MNILVINVGSSSIKFSLLEFPAQRLLTHGLIENNDNAAFEQMYRQIKQTQYSVDAVGHRVVHGGNLFSESALINEDVIAQIEALNELAPLHNPLNLSGIKRAMKTFNNVKHIAVFDTAFHQSIPEYAYRYPLPHELYERYGIRKYGFHGSSHHYLAQEAACTLQRPIESLKLITVHLGNGSSICAIKHGKSIDTTMGMTPLDGLMMGTRCGSIDPSIPLFLMQHTDLSVCDIDILLNKQSGLKAIGGNSDMRYILQAAGEHESNAQLALSMFVYRIKKVIGSYMAILGAVDAIIFSGGIGEHAAPVREAVCEGLEHFNISIDKEKNSTCNYGTISRKSSAIALMVIATNEELYIASEVQKKLK